MQDPILIIVLGFSLLVEGNLLKESVIHEVVLDGDNNYVMRWSPREKEVIFELQVATQGYIGLGFSHTGGMGGSDMVIAWVCEKGIPHISDRYATGNSEPLEDFSQDYTLFGGFRNATHTVMHFSRPWTTCDNDHDYQLSGDTVKVIWSYSNTIPSKGRFSYHEKRGTKSMFLQQPRVSPVPNSPDIKYLDIRAKNITIPSTNDTIYWCWIYKLPRMEEKNHFIGYIPLVDEESRPFFHHMIVRECTIHNSDLTYAEDLKYKGQVCDNPNMPMSWTACNRPIFLWAVGSEGELLPDHVGIPLHEEHGGSTYFMIEIHYDNPFFKHKIDQSGARIYYTAKTRKYDAAVFSVGHAVSYTQIIPPHNSWKTTAHCSSECTQQNIPKDGIHVLSAVLHTHFLGRSLNLQLIREGKELEPLFQDNHYDANYQQLRILPEERVIKPGDHLITTCGYDSTDRNTTTFGGEGAMEEMCLMYIFYYPRMNIQRCYSYPEIEGISNSLDLANVDKTISSKNNEAKNKEHRFELAAKFYEKLDIKNNEGNALYNVLMKKSTWENHETVNKLQDTIMYKPHTSVCQYDPNRNLTKYSRVEYPNYITIKNKGQELSCIKGKRKSQTTKSEENNDVETSLQTFIYHVQQQMKNDKPYNLKDEVQKYVSNYLKTHKLINHENNGSSQNYNIGALAYIFTTVLIYWLF